MLQGPAGEPELQQIIDKCENPAPFETLLEALRTKLEAVRAWTIEARDASGKMLPEARQVLERGRALNADPRLIGRLAEQVAGAEGLRSRMAAVLEADCSTTDGLTDRGCDLRACRALLQESERVPFPIPEREQLAHAVSKAEACLPLLHRE